MATVTTQAQGIGRRFQLLLIAAVAVAVLLAIGTLELSARHQSTEAVEGTAPSGQIAISDLSVRGTLIHQRIAAAIARLDRTKSSDPAPACLPCIQRRVQMAY